MDGRGAWPPLVVINYTLVLKFWNIWCTLYSNPNTHLSPSLPSSLPLRVLINVMEVMHAQENYLLVSVQKPTY